MACETDLIAAIYDCVIDASGWEGVVRRISKATKSIGGGLVTHRADGTAQIGSRWNVNPFYANAYLQHYHKISPLIAAAWRVTPGEVKAQTHLTQSDSYKASKFYNEWARPQGWGDIVAVGLLRTPTAVLQLRLPRPLDAIWVQPREWHLLQTLAPHLQRAAELHQLLLHARAVTNSLGAAVAAAGFAIFLLAGDCRILFANAIAEDLLQCGTFLRCHHGRLAATHSCATSRLHALVCAAARPAHTEDGIGGSIELPRCADSPPLTTHVIPLAVGQAVSIFDFDQPAAAVFVIDPAANFGRQIKHFATRFGLTTAETRVFEEIIRGKGLSAAAEQLKIGKATAHTHAIRIFAKTGTEGQAHLLRRFFEMSLPGSPGAS